MTSPTPRPRLKTTRPRPLRGNLPPDRSGAGSEAVGAEAVDWLEAPPGRVSATDWARILPVPPENLPELSEGRRPEGPLLEETATDTTATAEAETTTVEVEAAAETGEGPPEGPSAMREGGPGLGTATADPGPPLPIEMSKDPPETNVLSRLTGQVGTTAPVWAMTPSDRPGQHLNSCNRRPPSLISSPSSTSRRMLLASRSTRRPLGSRTATSRQPMGCLTVCRQLRPPLLRLPTITATLPMVENGHQA